MSENTETKPKKTVRGPESRVEIKPAKGRPMLTWVGKKPLRYVTAYPVQPIEQFNLEKTAIETASQIWQDWPKKIPQAGLLFHGDNKDVLAWLLANGFRGQVKLIYIDPPFDSGADYIRQINLRRTATSIEAEGYVFSEQIQYSDIWANDNYLQFMYERLLLLRELLSDEGTIWLHCDWHKNYLLRCLLDEVFGKDNFRNEIVWHYYNKMQGNVNRFASNHDTLLVYQKGLKVTFSPISEERERSIRQLKRIWNSTTNSLVNAKDASGNLIYIDSEKKALDDVWRLSMLQPADETENLRFPTQKPELLSDIIISSSTKPDDLILDCFLGSGTTAMVAQKLGRRWIGVDINKGAIQTTIKRLQGVIQEQQKAQKSKSNNLPGMETNESPVPAQAGFAVYRVNDYDLQIQHNEAFNLAVEHLGMTRTKTDAYFDGTLGKRLVKIVPFNHPVTALDLEEVKRELSTRPDEERDILVVGLGKELAVDAWLEEWNKLRRQGNLPNKIEVIELRTDPKYGGFFTHEPAQAKIVFNQDGDKVRVVIDDFISPTILERLRQQNKDNPLFQPHVEDWRSMVDSVMIDANYDGEVFNICLADVPEKKNDLVNGKYLIEAAPGATIAVKITDMLGEEVLTVQKV